MPPLQYKPSPRRLSGNAPAPPGDSGDGDSHSGLWGAVAALLLVGVVVLGIRIYNKSQPPPGLETADAGEADAASFAPAKRLPPRCSAVSKDAFVIGEPSKMPPRNLDADAAVDDEEEFDELAPFAVELGRGAAFDGGFAVGALRDGEGGSIAMVATLGADGSGGKLVRLGRSRGDFDAPTVVGYKGSVLAAMLEPHAGGRAIRVARVKNGEVTWGPEFSEGRDESLAVDLASSGSHAVLVWDDVTKDGKRTMVLLSTFDPETMKSNDEPRPVSPPKQDAESPRVVARPGGYWLVYAVVGDAKKGKDEDTGSDGETISPRWLEVLPLDETGTPVSLPRVVTPRDGHALAFDVEPSDDGGLLLAYRDDDTPSGSSGGKVLSLTVRLSGAAEPRLMAEETASSGVPDLLPGWLSLSSLSGATRLAPMSEKGELLGELRAEPELGNGEVLAATRAALLVARPSGKAMKLSVMRCAPDEVLPDAGVEAGIAPP